jgi:hypothetical protein
MATFLATTTTPLASEPMTWIWIVQQTKGEWYADTVASIFLNIYLFLYAQQLLSYRQRSLSYHRRKLKKEQKSPNPISIFFSFWLADVYWSVLLGTLEEARKE